MKVHKDYNEYKVMLHPMQDIWQVLLYKGEADEAGQCEAAVKEYIGEPSLETIKGDVLAHHDRLTDERILTGYRYEGALVWLSRENQINYKAAFDLAMQFGGQHGTLPVTFKLGTTEEPVYHRFETLEALQGFYLGIVGHIQTELLRGWTAKDKIDWSVYEASEGISQTIE